jgi:hypothetical protein
MVENAILIEFALLGLLVLFIIFLPYLAYQLGQKMDRRLKPKQQKPKQEPAPKLLAPPRPRPRLELVWNRDRNAA